MMLKRVIAFPFIVLVRFYQWVISPIFPSNCRYNPTCSEYMVQAIQEWGVFKGIYLGVKRISRCHPYGGHGDDFVPKKNK